MRFKLKYWTSVFIFALGTALLASSLVIPATGIHVTKPSFGEIASVPYRQHPRYRGVIGHWIMGEGGGSTIRDISGFGNDGVLTNMDLATVWVNKEFGPALDFDGVDDFVAITNNGGILDLDISRSYTWSMWTNSDDFEEWNSVWTQITTVELDPQFQIYAHTTTNTQWGLLTAGISVGWRTDGTNKLILHSTDNVLVAGTRHNIVVTYDATLAQASRIKIYVNAVDVTDTGDITSAGSISNIASTVTRVGNDTFANDNHDGIADEIRMYERLLVENEIWSLYTDPFLEFRPSQLLVRAPAAAAARRIFMIGP